MTTRTSLTILLSVTIYLLTSCGKTDNNKTDSVTVDSTFSKSLIEKQIGKSDYYVSIPTDYSIKETEDLTFLFTTFTRQTRLLRRPFQVDYILATILTNLNLTMTAARQKILKAKY